MSIFLTNTELVAASKTKSRQKPLQKPDKGAMGKGRKLEDAAELTVELLNSSFLTENIRYRNQLPTAFGHFSWDNSRHILYVIFYISFLTIKMGEMKMLYDGIQSTF